MEENETLLSLPFTSSSSLKLSGNTLCLMSSDHISSIQCSLGSIFPFPVLIMMIVSNGPNGFNMTKITSYCMRNGVKFDQETPRVEFRAQMQTTDEADVSSPTLLRERQKLSRMADRSQNREIGPTSKQNSITGTGSNPNSKTQSRVQIPDIK